MASETSTEAGWLLSLALQMISDYLIFSLTASWSSVLLLFQGCSLLQRSKSFCQTEIEKLLDGEDGSNELIGDFTKVRRTAAFLTLIVVLNYSSNPIFSFFSLLYYPQWMANTKTSSTLPQRRWVEALCWFCVAVYRNETNAIFSNFNNKLCSVWSSDGGSCFWSV